MIKYMPIPTHPSFSQNVFLLFLQNIDLERRSNFNLHLMRNKAVDHFDIYMNLKKVCPTDIVPHRK